MYSIRVPTERKRLMTQAKETMSYVKETYIIDKRDLRHMWKRPVSCPQVVERPCSLRAYRCVYIWMCEYNVCARMCVVCMVYVYDARVLTQRESNDTIFTQGLQVCVHTYLYEKYTSMCMKNSHWQVQDVRAQPSVCMRIYCSEDIHNIYLSNHVFLAHIIEYDFLHSHTKINKMYTKYVFLTHTPQIWTWVYIHLYIYIYI